MRQLIRYSSRLVVMTERGRAILQQVYQVSPAKIDVIPHGIPDLPFFASDRYKNQFGVAGRKVLLTFGLLSPNKGIQHVLNALPDIIEEFPEVVYLLVGATHPNELRTRGEAYRLSLEAIVRDKKLEHNVIFLNRFVELNELTEYIGAADLYVTPYLDEAQITSGTLAYAFGAGKAVISTPYWHAAELLSEQRGVLVPFADPNAIAREVRGLLRDEARRSAMSMNAYKLGREWCGAVLLTCICAPSTARGIREQRVAATLMQCMSWGQRPCESPELNLNQVCRMTDSTGIVRHASISTPSLSGGYSTDDNARALILTASLSHLEEAPRGIRALATTYASFLNRAFNPRTNRFHNFLSSDGRWLDESGSEDCHGRAIWALGTAAGSSLRWSSHAVAEQLFATVLPAVKEFSSPRAWAFTLIGIHEYLRRLRGERLVLDIRDELADRLVAIFETVATPGWIWFEEELAYDNAKLAHALIVSGRGMGKMQVYQRGMRALRWLVGVQTSKYGQLRPIGTRRIDKCDHPRMGLSQQPTEAQSTISACLEAYRSTGNSWWYEQAQGAFDWFLGWNDLGLEVYCPQTGGCRDGLHKDGVNENQVRKLRWPFCCLCPRCGACRTQGPAKSDVGSQRRSLNKETDEASRQAMTQIRPLHLTYG